MKTYNGKDVRLELGKEWMFGEETPNMVYFTMRSWGNYIIEAQPRYGKSVVAKDLAVQISKHRQIIVFDFAGEWKNSVTKYNKYCPFPSRLIDFNVYQNFTFKITEFSNKEDFASFGFEKDQAGILAELIKDTAMYHKGQIALITEILQKIPTRGDTSHEKFNLDYGAKLTQKQHSATKTTICTHWDLIKKYFWQGDHDKRMIYDFKKELLKGKHMIINLGDDDFSLKKFVGRAYIGKILERMSQSWKFTRPFIFVEEARTFFPNYSNMIQLSSNVQIYDLVTYAPKEGVSIMFIAQHENQLYEPIFQNIHGKIVGVVKEPDGKPEFKVKLEYNPLKNLREFLYIDVDSTTVNFRYRKFRPRIPCMQFKSDK